MKQAISLLIFALFTFQFLYGQEAGVLKRPPYKLTIEVNKDSYYEEELKENPYVLPNNIVQIYPGETVYIEVEQENGIVKKMTAVTENKNPKTTLVISFTQKASNHVHESMTLNIKNPFASTLIYKARIFLLNKKKWVETDVLPIEPGLAGIEIWPDIISSIGLGEWKFENK